MSLRLFLAIPLPEAVCERLLQLRTELAGASWREADQYHLTLCFIGEVDEAVARDIDTEVGAIRAAPFELSVEGIGSFGGREPSAVWAGLKDCPDLIRLAQACERAVRRAGLRPPARRYHPHITLAYLRAARDVDVAQFISRTGEFRTLPFIVDHFCMYSSHPTRSGSRYVEQAVYPLPG